MMLSIFSRIYRLFIFPESYLFTSFSLIFLYFCFVSFSFCFNLQQCLGLSPCSVLRDHLWQCSGGYIQYQGLNWGQLHTKKPKGQSFLCYQFITMFLSQLEQCLTRSRCFKNICSVTVELITLVPSCWLLNQCSRQVFFGDLWNPPDMPFQVCSLPRKLSAYAVLCSVSLWPFPLAGKVGGWRGRELYPREQRAWCAALQLPPPPASWHSSESRFLG